MKKIILMLSLLILQLSIISALTIEDNGIDVVINNNTISFQNYVMIGSIKNPWPGTLAIEPKNYSFEIFSVSCRPFDINISSNITGGTIAVVGYEGNCTASIYKSIDTHLIDTCSNETKNQTILMIDEGTIINYTQCLNDKSQIETNLRNCASDYYKCNITSSEYVKCRADLAVCNTKDEKISELNTKIADMTNQKYIWGVVGLVAGIVGYMFYTGKIGGQKAKQAGENYQRGQSA